MQPAVKHEVTSNPTDNGNGVNSLLEDDDFQMLNDSEIGGPVLEKETRPFIPVSIPRSDDG